MQKPRIPEVIKVSDTIELRQWTSRDAHTLFTLIEASRDYLRRWLLWVDGVKTKKHSASYIQQRIRHYHTGETCDFGVWHNGHLVGAIGLNKIDHHSRKAELGYWIAKDQSGQGIARSVAATMVTFGFHALGLHRIVILCDTNNAPSIRLAEHLGFTHEGTVRDDELRYGTFFDYHIYSRIVDERQRIDAEDAFKKAKKFATHIRAYRASIIRILTTYETHHVANDEIERTLDLLENLEENSNYFARKVRNTVVFLPINQPLYALVSFAVIPSIVSREVFVRPPQVAWPLMHTLVKRLQLQDFLPNIFISNDPRMRFIKQHANEQTSVVIFTGNSRNALIAQKRFGPNVLFIGNGSSHNPVVISSDASIKDAVEGVVEVQLYNQGGDCAAPNAILVHADVYDTFLHKLRQWIKHVHVGSYRDTKTLVGPFLDREHFLETRALLDKMQPYLDPSFPGEIVSEKRCLMKPAIIIKPLREGGNHTEQFAPMFFVQRYETDDELADYFNRDEYREHAGYITLYGTSTYVESLIGEPSDGYLHTEETIVRNTHLHAPGVERGVMPYGGYGRHSSFIAYEGWMAPKPTLPQRDIFENLVAYGESSLGKLQDDIVSSAQKIFGEYITNILLTGSVPYGGGVLGQSDLDIVIILRDDFLGDQTHHEIYTRCRAFAFEYLRIHDQYGFRPDTLFPGEFLTESMVRDTVEGRGFSVKNSRLFLPKTSNDYYLESAETWFQAWLSMLASGVVIHGPKQSFEKTRREAWRTILLHFIAQRPDTAITVEKIINTFMQNTNKDVQYGFTSNYFLFKTILSPTLHATLEMLAEEGIVKKIKGKYHPKKERVQQWERTLVHMLQKNSLRRAQLLLHTTDVVAIAHDANTQYTTGTTVTTVPESHHTT